MQTTILFALFWALQVFAVLAFKWGSSAPTPEAARRRFLTGFIGGNAVGMSSMWALMIVYKTMNPNVAFGIGMGGAFLLAQVSLALVFRSRLSLTQLAGLAAMAIGMLFLGLGGAS